MTKYFPATLATRVKIMSLVALAILGVCVLVMLRLPTEAGAFRVWGAAGMLSIPLIAALFTVRGYQMSGRTLGVRRLFWTTEVDLEGLRGVEADPEAMSRSIRLFGNGGLFAMTGWFRNGKLGLFRAYVTAPDQAVVLRFDEGTLVVSPDRPDALVTSLREHFRLS